MSVLIEIDDLVRFPVTGNIVDATGQSTDFEFEVDMRRLAQEEFDKECAGQFVDTHAKVVREARGWSGVMSREGEAVPFTAQALARFLKIPGMANLIWVAYCSHAGVQAKNSARSSG